MRLVSSNTFGTRVILDFGSAGSDLLVTTVTGQTWVQAKQIIQAVVADDDRCIEALLEGIRVQVFNLVPGIGFDIAAFAPNGRFYGQLEVYASGGA